MIKRNQKNINLLNALSDAILLFVIYPFSAWLWLGKIKPNPNNISSLSNWNFSVVLCALAYSVWTIFLLTLLSAYHTNRLQNRFRRYSVILMGNTIGMATLTTFLYFIHFHDFSRGVLILYYVLSCAALIGKRYFMLSALRLMRMNGYNLKHALVVGSGALVETFKESVKNESELGLIIDDIIRPDKNIAQNLERKLHGAGIDEVVLALEIGDIELLEDILRICESDGVKTSVIPFYNNVIPTRPIVENVGDVKLIRLRTTPLDEPASAFVKRAFDIIACGLALVIISPLLLVIAIGIKITSPGPIIFKQERVGLNRKTYAMYKFRSMRINSEEKTAWSSNVDNRRTIFGSLLRKTSLDELPQLWNVLKGDMSLVGPRPEIPHYVDQFRETVPLYMVKHQVRPGITGWAQVKGYRGDTSIPERIKCDIWYIENWSFWLDVKIIFLTVFGGMINREKIGVK